MPSPQVAPWAERHRFIAFLFQPTRYMDPSWWDSYELPEGLCTRLVTDPRSHRHLSRRVHRELGLGCLASLEQPLEAFRIVLMDEQRLDRLLVLAGLTLISPTISGVLHRRERRRIKSGVGADGYEFAVRRGRFLLQRSRLGDVVPVELPLDFDMPLPRCRGLGMSALAAALSDAPTELVRRLQLKFPRTSVERHWQPLAAKPVEFMRLFTLLDRQADVA